MRATFSRLVAQLRKAPPPLQDPATTRPHQLQPTGVGANLKINWGDVNTTPGFIAGGTGSVDIPSLGRTFLDTRDIVGTYVILPTVDAKGVLQKVMLRLTGLQLKINDSIDFCPGNLGGWKGEFFGRTLDMSRLERTPHPAGGTWAKPILIDVNVPLDTVMTDITSTYVKAREE